MKENLNTHKLEELPSTNEMKFVHSNKKLTIQGNGCNTIITELKAKYPNYSDLLESLFTMQNNEIVVKNQEADDKIGVFCGPYDQVVIKFPDHDVMRDFMKITGLIAGREDKKYVTYTEHNPAYPINEAVMYFSVPVGCQDDTIHKIIVTLLYSINEEVDEFYIGEELKIIGEDTPLDYSSNHS